MASERIPLLIAGGGIGGLAAALAASRAGLSAHVLEKSAEFAEIGAGLQLAPNATRMLDRLGILEVILTQAVFPRRLVMMDAVTGKHITSLDLGSKFLEHFGYPYILMHRGDLLAAELAACQASPRITLENHKEVIAVEDLGDGARVACADGSVYECEALVGADGLWSTVRKAVHHDGDPVCAQFVAYRGTIPISQAPPESDLDNMTIWVGPDMHFVQYVVKSGALFNQVAVFRSYRYREDSEDWGTVEELEEHYGKLCPRVRTAVAKIKRDRRWAMCDRLPIANWTRNRITLLGDAAHPMLQYIAQGACQALEDAVCLGDNLRQYPRDATCAFAAYQEQRIPRTARVQAMARFFGEVKHVDGVGRALRNALLEKRAADDFEYFEWLYGYQDVIASCRPPAAG
ncbi:MAG: 3-hydroxybenzoate 6-hydroxylase [Terriglobia bacterium]|nr:MAG: 3-hydroxybenzoate 6-hydroxylase [Terriglobia bacterium]